MDFFRYVSSKIDSKSIDSLKYTSKGYTSILVKSGGEGEITVPAVFNRENATEIEIGLNDTIITFHSLGSIRTYQDRNTSFGDNSTTNLEATMEMVAIGQRYEHCPEKCLLQMAAFIQNSSNKEYTVNVTGANADTLTVYKKHFKGVSYTPGPEVFLVSVTYTATAPLNAKCCRTC